MRRGYTLIEALIYLTILAFLSVVFVSLLLTMSRAYFEFRLARDVSSSASAGLDGIVRTIRDAKTIDPSSDTGTHPGYLVLNTTLSGEETTVEFFLTDGALMVKRGSDTAAPLSGPSVVVENLVFRQINTAVSSAVKIELTVSATHGQTTRTQNYYATAVLRGGY